MALSDWLAAAGGGLQAYDQQQHDDKEFALRKRGVDQRDQMERDRAAYQQKVLELRDQLEQLKEGGRTTRNAATNSTRRDIADQRDETAHYGIDTRAATSEGNNTRSNTTRQRGQDLADTHYWDKAQRDMDLGWGRIDLGQRGQDVAASTARRGQDLGYGAREDAIDATDSSRAMGYAVNAYKADLARRRQNNSLLSDEDAPDFGTWLQSSEDPEIFPSVQRMFNRGGASDATPATAPAPGAPAYGGPKSSPVPSRRPRAAGPSLEDQARTLITQIKAAQASGADTTALKAKLKALRDQAQ